MNKISKELQEVIITGIDWYAQEAKLDASKQLELFQATLDDLEVNGIDEVIKIVDTNKLYQFIYFKVGETKHKKLFGRFHLKLVNFKKESVLNVKEY